jgi:hypothetical protein
MPFIPRQVKPPARVAVTYKLPQSVAILLKGYAEFLDSSQEYVVTETLQLAFRKDREFQVWLTTAHPEMARALHASPAASRDQTSRASTAPDRKDVPARRASTPAPAAPGAVTPPSSQER